MKSRSRVLLLLCGVVFAACAPHCRIHQNIVYDARLGEAGTFDEYVPSRSGPHPAVVFIHGGAWQSGDKSGAREFAPAVAGRGYAVLAINYRLAPRDVWPAQLDDCRSAIRYIRANAGDLAIDRDRVAVLGVSAGGQLASLVGLTDDPSAAAGFEHVPVFCSVSGQSDLASSDEQQSEPRNLAALFGGPPAWSKALLDDASPVAHCRRDVHALLVHGELDPFVSVKQSDELDAALRSAGADVTYLRRHSAAHDALKESRVVDAVVAFLDAHL
jgi:acetyl esterase/lipase